MARPIWKGHITFGLVNIPVVLYPAEQRSDLSFRMIDSRNNAKIRYERVNDVTGEEVPWDNIVKAYEFSDDNYVMLTEADFKKAAVEATQSIEIEDFVDLAEIDIQFFEKPYFLVPDKKGDKGYVLLREALQRSGKAGIARLVIHTRQHLAALRAHGDALVVDLLRFKQELRDLSDFKIPSSNPKEYKVNDREIELAEQLIDSMSGPWKPEQYHDEYREALMAFIEKKAKTGTVPVEEDESEADDSGAEVVDMMAMLKKSVEGRGSKATDKANAKAPAKAATKTAAERRKAAPSKKAAKKAAKKSAKKASARRRVA